MSLWRRWIAVFTGVLLVAGCGSGTPEAGSQFTVPATAGITEAALTSVTTTTAVTSVAPTTAWGIEVTDPGRQEPILITTPDAAERRVAEDTTTDLISDGPEELGEEPVSEERVFYLSPFVVIGEITGIDGPFWNQANGQKWTDEFEADPVPRLYREVSVNVERVIDDDADIVGDALKLVVSGGGTPQEAQPWLGGKFLPGERVLLFLEVRPWSQREAMLLTFSPVWGRGRGVYHLVDQDGLANAIPDWETHHGHDQLSTPDPRSFVPLEQVVERIEGIRSVQHPQWEKFEPTKEWILASLLYYQEWVRTGEFADVMPTPEDTTGGEQ